VLASTSDQGQLTMPTFPLAAADLARRVGVIAKLDQAATASRRAWGGQTERTTWIDYRGPAGTVPSVSAIDVLDGRTPDRTFRDKVVVIGVVARAAGDVLKTPVDDAMPGVEVQANALDTMLRGEPLRDVPPLVDIALIVLLACVPVVCALWWSTRATVAVAAGLAVLMLAASQLAFQDGWIVAVVVPFAALVMAACGVAALAATQTLARRLAARWR
jgi:adenylate cyclase